MAVDCVEQNGHAKVIKLVSWLTVKYIQHGGCCLLSVRGNDHELELCKVLERLQLRSGERSFTARHRHSLELDHELGSVKQGVLHGMGIDHHHDLLGIQDSWAGEISSITSFIVFVVRGPLSSHVLEQLQDTVAQWTRCTLGRFSWVGLDELSPALHLWDGLLVNEKGKKRKKTTRRN